MPELRISAPQKAVSWAMVLAKASRVPIRFSMPFSVKRRSSSASRATRSRTRPQASRASEDRLSGAARPNQFVKAKPGRVVDMSGTSGKSGLTLVEPKASARRLPSRMKPINSGKLPNIMSQRPPMMSATAAGPPRYGTCTSSTPASFMNNSPARWCVVPMPADPKVSSPGRRFASAMRSETPRAGLRADTTSVLYTPATFANGSRARLVSIGITCPGSCGMMLCIASEFWNTV